jgi:thioredoxin-related protein
MFARLQQFAISFILVSYCFNYVFAITNPMQFDDRPTVRHLKYPEWFKQSFLNLPEELQEAEKARKIGIIVYFGQDNCAYCDALLNVNFKTHRDIVAYTRKFFEVIPIHIWGQLDVITTDHQILTEKSFSDREKTNFTPSLIFYNTKGEEIFRMRGYYPPYRFRAALDYIVGEYYRQETFRQFLERAEVGMVFAEDGLNEDSAFSFPPFVLNRQIITGERPLMVVFEQSHCHACDLFHSNLLKNIDIRALLSRFDVVQLDMWADTPVITPQGLKVTASQWAKNLDLFYTPTLLFFDEQGQEIIRIDSTVQLYRLYRVMMYVLDKIYLNYPLFLRWSHE